MGVGPSYIAKANFEDIQSAIDNNDILINTLPHNQQNCLITNTKNVYNEESLINSLLNNKEYSKLIFIYGKNSNDYHAYEKYFQF